MFGRKTLFKGSSEYGSYRVIDMIYDGRDARVLFGDAHTPQSGTALDGDAELLFNYNQRFLEMVISMRPKRLLVIGGGVMMLPVAVYERLPDVQIDVVEIDPLLTELAYDYFKAPRDERLEVYNVDGKVFLQGSSARYDMIIIDAFTGFDIPVHLLERETVALYKSHLNDDGVVAINAISRISSKKPKFSDGVIATLGEEFQELSLYPADPTQPRRDEQNVIVVAAERAVEFDYLQSEDVIC